MKNYRITVNGVAYDVAVEELGAGEASAAPVSTPAAVPAPAKKAAPKTSGTGRCFCKEGRCCSCIRGYEDGE